MLTKVFLIRIFHQNFICFYVLAMNVLRSGSCEETNNRVLFSVSPLIGFRKQSSIFVSNKIIQSLCTCSLSDPSSTIDEAP